MEPYRLPRPLDPVEQRVLGCLVEKELSTPDAYPLSLNALTAACNQRSNRQPVMSLEEAEISGALSRLLPEVLVWRLRTSRVERWQHNLDAKWAVGDGGKAILAELLLRGAQTPGELRSRCSRMHAFPELEEVEATLARLAAPQPGLAVELPRQPGQKESRWSQTLGDRAAAPALLSDPPPAPSTTASHPPEAPPTGVGDGAGVEERLRRLESKLERFRADLLELRRELDRE